MTVTTHSDWSRVCKHEVPLQVQAKKKKQKKSNRIISHEYLPLHQLCNCYHLGIHMALITIVSIPSDIILFLNCQIIVIQVKQLLITSPSQNLIVLIIDQLLQFVISNIFADMYMFIYIDMFHERQYGPDCKYLL